MSNARRSIAQLRAEKKARQQSASKGMELLKTVIQVVDEQEMTCVLTEESSLAILLEKITRACALLEHGNYDYYEQGIAYQCKGKVQRDIGQIAEALATLREAQRLFTMARTQVHTSVQTCD